MDKRLKKILIKTKRQIFSEIAGNNASLFEGEGFEFAELREYMPGDDVRKIDWNITAKMQKPYVKVFKEERELNIVIASLLGGSVYFGKKKLKISLMAEIAALLAFSSIKNGDRFSSYIFTDRLKSLTKPTKKFHALNQAVEEILNFNPLKEGVDFEEFSKYMLKNIKRRSIVFVLGDFFEIPNFKRLAKKHEVIALIVRDRLEEDPIEFGYIDMIDPVTMTETTLDITDETLKEYKKTLFEHDNKLYNHFNKSGIRFVKIYTDDEPFPKLSKLFAERK